MKRLFTVVILCLSNQAWNAQDLPTLANTLDEQRRPSLLNSNTRSAAASSQRIIWSEDFANGIPSSWSQNGVPTSALWEYRGPNTNPVLTSGSRGYYSGINNSPATNGPLASSSDQNGFIIFDSDYLDNGNTSVAGSGSAPAPHLGSLSTELIDLSNEASVELKFETYARRYSAHWLVAFSTNGGQSFPDTIEFFPTTKVPVSSSSLNGDLAIANVSPLIGNQDSVVIQFIFDGRDSLANGSAYYFWMIDDLELRSVPRNRLEFTESTAGSKPDVDLRLNNDSLYPKYGIMPTENRVPIDFKASIINTGSETQTNVSLVVEIFESTSGIRQLVSILNSTGCANLASGDTCSFSNLITSQWTPPNQQAYYQLVYKAISDSVSRASINTADTFSFFVQDHLCSTDRNQIDNYIGTKSANPNISALGTLFDLNYNPCSTGLQYCEGFELSFSPETDPTGSIQLEVYDTAGFSFPSGFPTGTNPIYTKSYPLDQSMPGSSAYFATVDNDIRLAFPLQAYFFVIKLIPNAPNGEIGLANDQSFKQPGFSTIMQTADGNWYSGFNGREHEGLFLRLNTGLCLNLDERAGLNFSMHPNPSKGRLEITLPEGGSYELKVKDLRGTELMKFENKVNDQETLKLELQSLKKGIYLIEVSDGKKSSSQLLSLIP